MSRLPAAHFGPTHIAQTAFAVNLYIPPDRAGRALDLWVAYFAHLKTSVKHYEGQNSLQVFPNIQIMYKDPYFVTTSARSIEKFAFEGAQSKKRKFVHSKSSKGRSVSGSVVKKARHEPESTPADVSNTRTPPKKGTQNRSPKVKRELAIGTRASERLKAKPSNKVFPSNSPSHPIVISDVNSSKRLSNQVEDKSPSPPPTTHAATQGSSVEKEVNEEVANYPADSASKEVMGSPADTSPHKVIAQSNALALPSPVPVQALSVEVVPILASLLPDYDAHVLSEFSAHHAGFLFPENAFPQAFLKPAYALFVNFLRFVCSHSAMELLSSYKNKVVEDLKALSVFGFKGDWFDDLSCRFDRHIPSAALEDLTKITDTALSLELHNNDLRSEIDRLKLELSQGEAELEQLNAKRREVE
ncbi:hypothetical protein SESBI_32840 [Sesbania bispinosa]|nr:hypothetical protein SESBI_32840 [Sesbania bispinosa]